MKSPPTDRRVLTLFPFILASVLIFGITRLVTETSSASWSRALRRSFPAIFSSARRNAAELDHVLDRRCNLFEGKWVLDEHNSRPLYTEDSCPYLTRQLTCQRNGRPDSLYQKWRWKPHSCDLPRFDAVKLLESLRNKRLMFIGDSIQRTQWESMVCLLQSGAADNKKYLHKDPPRKIFVAEEFNASIEFYWAPFIVESNSDHATKHTVQKRLVHLDSIAKHGRNWKGVDVMVFNSYVWWMYKPLINATIGTLDIWQYGVPTAYRMALQTWAKWIESTVNPQNQKLFFMSSSPTHLWSWEWKAGSSGNCFNETYPIEGPYWGTGSSLDIMGAVRDALRGLKVKVTLLNITQLSEFRKDGHTSVYTERRGKLLTSEQRSEPNVYADCIHWCLPGVPDTWNEILYAHLLNRKS
ncbi:protein trichome birefringence-like 31 [Phoenix dactylifera]|uniref:Protein trichome birefringence-like 31 n=1 Tax=Phoenix dactylifera TaxID=42345 RepID=A0A8B8ZZM0_PHODC|nr:protein trichome birefringence-like 31 [Phoenix dactylifera]